MSQDNVKFARRASGTEDLDNGLFYLWHLAAIGLVTWNEDGSVELSEYWKTPDPSEANAETPAEQSKSLPKPAQIRVAIIDNGCAADHPNLPNERITQVEFSSHRSGIIYTDDTVPANDLGLRNISRPIRKDIMASIREKLKDNDLEGEEPNIDEFLENPLEYVGVQNPSHRFGAHGTATAGLVAATSDSEMHEKYPDHSKRNPWAIRYSGVDPYAEIIAINTVYNYECWPFTAGLLFALRSKADVILIPRAAPRMSPPKHKNTKQFPNSKDDPRHTRLDEDKARYIDQLVFEAVLGYVCKHVPTVVAAGNTGIGGLAYPASLSTLYLESDGFPLISVGALTAYGKRSAFSAGVPEAESGEKPFIYAPSNDDEVISKDHQRFDELSWRGRNTNVGAILAANGSENTYCPYGILAIDIPGPWGYDVQYGEARDFEDPIAFAEPCSELEKQTKAAAGLSQNRYNSLYTLFGGTSASSAIVAGVISQMLRAAKEAKRQLKVEEVTEILKSTAGKGLNMVAIEDGKYGAEVPDIDKAIRADDAIEKVRTA
ncbi:MAG: S8/S53 family peptidase [Pseudomonadota bacterium]